MSPRRTGPAVTLDRIATAYTVAGAGMVQATHHTIRPTVVEVVQLVDEGGVKATAYGPVLDDEGNAMDQNDSAFWFEGACFAPELTARLPLSDAPSWVRDIVARALGERS